MKKLPIVFKQILVKEWFSKSRGKVYLNWEFQDGKRMRRLTPYKDFPYVVIPAQKENK